MYKAKSASSREVRKIPEVIGGHYDADGFYILPNNDGKIVFKALIISVHLLYLLCLGFYDPDGYFFDKDGYDEFGGYYDDYGYYVPG